MICLFCSTSDFVITGMRKKAIDATFFLSDLFCVL